MPLAALDPATAKALAAIGLPYGANPNPALVNVASGPGGTSPSYNAMNLSTQLGANPALSGGQAATAANAPNNPASQQQEAQQASQQDTQAIYSDAAMEQKQAAQATSQAARLQAAQVAMQPTAGQQQQMQKPTFNAADAGANIDAAQAAPSAVLPASPGETTPASVIQALQSRTPGYASQQARLQAAQDASTTPAVTPVAPSGTPQAPPATTPAATPQPPSGPPPGPAAPPVPAQTTPATPQAPPPPTPPATQQGQAGSPQVPTQPAGPTPEASSGKYAPGQIYAALVKQGIPANDAATITAISGAESGYGAHPVSGKNTNGTTDYGLFQVNSGAWPQLHPESLPNADLDTNAAAAAEVYRKQGLSAWSTYNSGAYKKFAGDTQSMGQNSPPGTYSGIDAIHDGSSIGLDPQDMMKLATTLGYKPIDTQALNNRNLIAMGMAMMGGRTFADSMKNGAGVMNDSNNAMLGVQEKTNSNAMQLAQLGLNDKRTTAMMGMEQARLAAMDRPRPVGAPTQDAQGNWNQMFLDPRTSTTFAQPTGTPSGFASSDPTRKGLAASATEGAKEASKNFEEIQDNGNAATQKLQLINSVQKQLDSGQVTPGPAAAARLKTTIANWLGVPFDGADPNANQELVQAISAARGNGIMGKNMRTQREFDTVMQGALNYNGQNPAVLQNTLNAMRNVELAKQQMQQRINSDPNAANIRRDPIAMANFQQKFFTDWSNQQNTQGGINNPQPGTVIHYDSTGKPIQ